jgi:cytochrome d ubiquinol oxidase subunit I
MVFWTFRIMVGLGMLMIATGIVALVLYFRKTLFTTRWFHLWCMAMTPAGFVAVVAGWFVTEVGRQPFIVFNVLRTSETISPVAGAHRHLPGRVCHYLRPGVYRRGLLHPQTDRQGAGRLPVKMPTASHGVKQPPLVTDLAAGTGGKDV